MNLLCLHYRCRVEFVFLGNKLCKVGSGDIELLGLFADVCCTLGVDCALVVLTGLFCAMICIAMPDIEGAAHFFVVSS